ncbi:MAG: arsenate reductase ArsC [Deferribacterota bacterium]|nr:arsenate reductase ArsC [Deferribacterota bacterium]
MKKSVLFVCVHNSARSQMCEAFLKAFAGDKFEVESAGLEPGKLNPIVVESMKEIGIDISKNKTKSVFDLLKSEKSFHYVITVCDKSQTERCPVFPSTIERIHWEFDDPSRFQGTYDEKLAQTRIIRDKIKDTIKDWINKFDM